MTKGGPLNRKKIIKKKYHNNRKKEQQKVKIWVNTMHSS